MASIVVIRTPVVPSPLKSCWNSDSDASIA
jgi:hypothetical protein